MNAKEKDVACEAILTELEFWKFRKPMVISEKKIERGVYAPDFLLLREASRIFGRPVQTDEKVKLLKAIKQMRVSRRARFEDFNKT